MHHVCFAAQGEHCYFYRQGTQIASQMKIHTPPRTSNYACYKVRETFEPERG